MIRAEDIFREVEMVTEELIKISFADKFNFPIIRNDRGVKSILWAKSSSISISLKNIPYNEIYDVLNEDQEYNIKLPDGALLQMLYRFDGEGLHSHRLAMFSSPYLEKYQNQPESYEEDELYAEILNKNIVSFPIRFDYFREEIDSDIEHPFSHATLGQYENCRIPVYGPLTPIKFTKFILRNFYYTPFQNLELDNLASDLRTDDTIRYHEKMKIHFNLE